MKLSVIFSILFLAVVVFAQTAPAPVAQPLAPVVQVAQSVDTKMPMSIPGWLLGTLSFLITEVLARAIPTAKPRSWLIAIAAIFAALGSILTKGSALLDSLLQNIKEEPPKA
jgi:hypothetical protein